MKDVVQNYKPKLFKNSTQTILLDFIILDTNFQA